MSTVALLETATTRCYCNVLVILTAAQLLWCGQLAAIRAGVQQPGGATTRAVLSRSRVLHDRSTKYEVLLAVVYPA